MATPTTVVPGKNGTEWTVTTGPGGTRVRHHYPVVDIPSPIDGTVYASEAEAVAAIAALQGKLTED